MQRRPRSCTAGDSQRLGGHWEPGTCSSTEEGSAVQFAHSVPWQPRLRLPRLGDRTVPSPPLSLPRAVCVDSASALQRPAAESKSEIKNPKVAARLSCSLFFLQVVNNNNTNKQRVVVVLVSAAGPAAVHGIAACEVRTTYRSQESMSHFGKKKKKAVQTWCPKKRIRRCFPLRCQRYARKRGRGGETEKQEEEG